MRFRYWCLTIPDHEALHEESGYATRQETESGHDGNRLLAMQRLIAKLIPGLGARKPSSVHPEIRRARQRLRSDEPEQAEQICQRVLATEPNNAQAHGVLGRVALQQGRNELAIEHFAAAINLDGQQADFHQDLGMAYSNIKQFAEAARSFQRAIALEGKNPATHNNLGNCYRLSGDPDAALRCFRKAIAVNSKYLPAYLNLAEILDRQRKHREAERTYRKALRAGADSPNNPDHRVLLHHRLGLTLRQLDKTDEAIARYQEALAIQPDFAMAHNSLGGALLARNDLNGALACFRTALDIEPDYARVHSNILLTLNYLPGITQQALYEESLKFDARHARRLMRGRKPLRNARNKQKVLKIGYLSPDFREHSVAFFTRKLFGAHNRDAVEVYGYGDVETPDDLTGQFQAQADHWRPITAMTDEEVAAQIRRDGIDILVDLAGHTANNRLLVFARKPAPIQVTWLGYPNTTGMKAMDYRLTDALADPPGEADRLHAEKLVRLEHGFLCYQSDESVPAVSPPPCLPNRPVTFGSFNTIKKVTPDVVRVWSRILQSLPDARLVMKSHALEDKTTKAGLLQAFDEHGITARRIDLINAVPQRKDHLKLYSGIDISLDPFPYNGTTTTFEALWMGVPVITWCGNRHAGRVGASILHHLGQPELVAGGEDEYVDLAINLAGDTARLATLRTALRPQLRRSTLMNERLFTKSLEHAYRNMWVAWCNKKR